MHLEFQQVSHIPVEILGAKGMFLGLIVSMLSCEIYSYLCKKEITIKMPNGVPEQVSKSFSALIPISAHFNRNFFFT